jgi:hypothetical protein
VNALGVRWPATAIAVALSVTVAGCSGSDSGLVASARTEREPSAAAPASATTPPASPSPPPAVAPRTVVADAEAVLGSPIAGIVAGDGHIWAVTRTEVLAVAPDTMQIERRFARDGAEEVGIAYGAGSVWLFEWQNHHVVRLNPKTGAREAVIPSESPQALHVDDGTAWLAQGSLGTVLRIDTKRNTVRDEIRVTPPGDHGPDTVKPDGDSIIVAVPRDEAVYVLDKAIGAIKRSVSTSPVQACGDVHVTPDRLYVAACAFGTQIGVIERRTDRLSTVDLGAESFGFAEFGGRVWVDAWDPARQESLSIGLDPRTLQVEARLRLSGAMVAFDFMWAPSGSRLMRLTEQSLAVR